MLEMSQISKVYRTELVETHALRELDLHVEEGEFVAVTGPSGSGKTTFLNIAGLLESPSSGCYRLDGEDVGALNDARRSRIRNAKVGFIFQSFNLIEELTIFENVELPLLYQGVSGAERKKRVNETLERFNMVPRRKHFPQQLSGGQQQMLAVGRALASEPRLLMVDEMSLGLAPVIVERLLPVVRRVADEAGVVQERPYYTDEKPSADVVSISTIKKKTD